MAKEFVDKRVFLVVLDSFGIGYEPDAQEFGDVGSNTLHTIAASPMFGAPVMGQLGLFHIDGVAEKGKVEHPTGVYGRLREKSKGKDTTIGHWEIAGVVSENPLPTYPEGFPAEIIKVFEARTGRRTICNKPYSGTEVIKAYGKEHVETGALIVYTSADSVFQIAAHEEVVPVEILYEYCEMARAILVGEHGVGRVIARPFTGAYPDFVRTERRHDFSLLPPKITMLDALVEAGYDTYGIGKIYDIFAGKGIQHTERTKNNGDGMEKLSRMQEKAFKGLCFVNLVDYDMLFGHRNDVDGYANAIREFDTFLGGFLAKMKATDILMITADHGCDPGFPGTDHTREYVPFLAYGAGIKAGVSLKTRESFADVAATIQELFEIEQKTEGTSFWGEIKV